MKKLFSKTVAALLSVACMSSVMTTSFNGKLMFKPNLTAKAEENTGLSFDASTGKLTLSGEVNTTDLLEYSNKDKVKSIEAEKGTILSPKTNVIFSGFKAETIDLSNFNTSLINDMSLMFSNCSNLKSLNLSGLDTKNVYSMNRMFDGCSSLESLDLSGFDTRNVNSMSHMFNGCAPVLNHLIYAISTHKMLS